MSKNLSNLLYSLLRKIKNREKENSNNIYLDSKKSKRRHQAADTLNFLVVPRALISPVRTAEINFERKISPFSISVKDTVKNPVAKNDLPKFN